ncbi:MAG: hypothetical protein JWO36_4939 [Myxococcales bacterium]|nr:hypothetical protein [Myxococcales bacterium]
MTLNLLERSVTPNCGVEKIGRNVLGLAGSISFAPELDEQLEGHFHATTQL